MGFIMLDNPNPYTPQGVHPRRGVRGKLTGTCILHTSEGNWQSGVAGLTRTVQTRTDYGCYHQACDWMDIAEYYPWEWETWQDSETNNWAVGIAAACKTSDWVTMPADIREGFYRNMAHMAADFVIYMRVQYGIEVPRRRISGEEARAGVPGFCAHGDSGIARSDPGSDFDWNKFFNYTEQALNGEIEENDVGTVERVTHEAMVNFKSTMKDAVREEVAGLYRSVAFQEKFVVASLTELLNDPDATVELTEENVAALGEALKNALAPELAAELAKRLAE